jgi:hypothetical protein
MCDARFLPTSLDETATDAARICRNSVDVGTTISTPRRIPGVLGWGSEVADARTHEAAVLAAVLAAGLVVGTDVYESVDFVLAIPTP